MLQYLWLIPLLPLAGSAAIGVLGLLGLALGRGRLNKRVVTLLALSSVGAAFLLSLACVYQLFLVGHGEIYSQDLFTWFSAGDLPKAGGGLARFEIPWGYELDPLSGGIMSGV